MTKKELFQETFSCLHASDTIYEEVLEMTENRQKRYHLRKAVVACTLAVLASGITVLAVARSGFFQSVFGTKGQPNTSAHVSEINNGNIVPAREWVEVDENTAKELLGEKVTSIRDSVTLYGYTLTVHDYTIDENGIGAATYTLVNPDGLDEVIFGEYGDYSLSPDSPLVPVSAESSSGKIIDTASIVDQTRTTDTELYAVLYFAPLEALEENEEILICLSGYEWDENGELLKHEVETIPLSQASSAPSITYTSEAGYTAHLSPLGIFFDGPIFEAVDRSWWTKKLLITYTDDSVYQVRDTDIFNQILSCLGSSGSVCTVFNRLVDTDTVKSITINGPDGTDMVFTR